MNNRYRDFSQSALGQAIVAIIDQKDRVIEFKAFSREGFPAVTALVSELQPIIGGLRATDPKGFNFAKQFVGDHVGDVMRGQGYQTKRTRSVPGKLFTVGALWEKRT